MRGGIRGVGGGCVEGNNTSLITVCRLRFPSVLSGAVFQSKKNKRNKNPRFQMEGAGGGGLSHLTPASFLLFRLAHSALSLLTAPMPSAKLIDQKGWECSSTFVWLNLGQPEPSYFSLWLPVLFYRFFLFLLHFLFLLYPFLLSLFFLIFLSILTPTHLVITQIVYHTRGNMTFMPSIGFFFLCAEAIAKKEVQRSVKTTVNNVQRESSEIKQFLLF